MSLSDFKVLEKLGSGAYSSVYKVKRILDEKIYALKKITFMGLTQKQKQNSLNQIRILASIRHPNIIGYRQAFLDEQTRSLCIIMQFADGGDLFQSITNKVTKKQIFEQKQIWSFLIQATKGLKLLHQKNIMHRDLKSANVFLVKSGEVKLGDMNVSKISQNGLCRTQTGTPYYASPQVWKDQPYGPKSDIWSLGCVLYEIMSLHPPFQAQDMQGLYKKVTKGIYTKPSSKYSTDLQDIIRLLLQTDPYKRPSCEKILKLKVVMKRMENSQNYNLEDNPEFLETIRIPTDIYYLTQNLPKPNYYTPRKRQNSKLNQSKTDKKHYKKQESKNFHIFPRVHAEMRDLVNKSLLLKNSAIIQADQSEIKQDKNVQINKSTIKKTHQQKKDCSLPTIKRKQYSIVMKVNQKLEKMQKAYRQPSHNKKTIK